MSTPTVAFAGFHSSPYTGAAVVHREIASRLGRHLPGVDILDVFRVGGNPVQRMIGMHARADVWITTSTPTPLRARGTVIPVVYDVRWQWTRRTASRWYRLADLKMSAMRATAVCTISMTVREQLRALRADSDGGVVVLDLGPGQMEGQAVPVVSPRPTILLVGAAAHKRNELAASLLTSIPEVVGGFHITGVSVSSTTKQILHSGFRPEQLTFLDDVAPEQLCDAMRDAGAYVALGTSEGFGFPYLEASYMGCDVVVPRYAVTRELLGDDASYLRCDEPSPRDLWAAIAAWDASRVGRLQRRATQRSWDQPARQIAELVRAGLATE